MSQSKPKPSQKQPDEALLLAYIEGCLSDEESKIIERNIIDQPALMSALLDMQQDRNLIKAIKLKNNIQTPPGMVDDVLAVMERTMLLDDAPDAPLISIKRKAPASWWRYAVAAAFLILVSAAVVMLFQGLFSPDNNRDLSELLTENPAINTAENNLQNTLTFPLAIPNTDNENHNKTDVNSNNVNDRNTTKTTTNNHLASDNSITKSNSDKPGNEEIADKKLLAESVGFTANIACADNNDALILISNAMQTAGGRIIPNAPDNNTNINYPNINDHNNDYNANYADQPYETDNRYKNLTTPSDQLPGNNLLHSELMSESINLVPLDDQISYRRDGYQYTLIGTPTAIKKLLTQLSKQPGYNFDWGRKPKDLSFDSFVIPPRPTGNQWIPAVMWWIDPHQNLSLSLDAAKSIQKEPIIRVPFRLVEKPYLKRQLERSKKNNN